MSSLSIPPFDALADQSEPFRGFGNVLPESADHSIWLQSLSADAKERIERGFGRRLNNPHAVPASLDDIVAQMWVDGWAPDTGNVNLFCRDFGLVLTTSIVTLMGGKCIFRSETDPNHLSIWWLAARLEVFPFHKVLKCLFHQEGESMDQFVRGLSGMLQQKDQTT